MHNDNNSTTELVAAISQLTAETCTLRELCYAIARAAGVDKLEGQNLRDWHEAKFRKWRERLTRDVDAGNPALSAVIVRIWEQVDEE